MKRFWLAAALAVPFGTAAIAADGPAPSDVNYEDGAVAQSLTGTPGDVESGKALMNKGSGNCIACHAVTDLQELPFHGEIGPMLDGVADRWSEAEIRGIVANAKEMFPGTMMPAFYKVSGYVRPGDAYTGKAAPEELEPILSAQQIEDVVAYLMTLKEE